MTNSRNVAIALLVGLIVGAALTYALATPTLGRTTTVTSATTTTTASVTQTIATTEGTGTNASAPRPPPSTQPLTLNSMAYAQGIVQGRLIAPNASILGSSWSIAGTQIVVPPQNVTTSNGIVFDKWAVDIIISNEQFVNGTAPSSAFLGASVIVAEGSSTGFYDSSGAAENFISPDQTCTTTTLSNGSTSSTCSPGNASPLKIVQIGSTYLAVDQNAPNAYFQIDGKNLIIQISGDLTYSQVLALAGDIIQS